MNRAKAHEHRSKLVGLFKNLGLAVFTTEGEKDQGAWGVAADHEGGRCLYDRSQLVHTVRNELGLPRLRRFEIVMSQLACALQVPNSNFVLFMSNGSVLSTHPQEIKTNHFSACDTS